ncbi:MAG: glycosyl hydrolase family 8 [Chloroflexota bacterium]
MTPSVTRREKIQIGLAIFFILSLAAFFTGRNLFNFPHYEFDEGLYISSAWAVVTQSRLDFYTYTYNNPPLGWFLLGGWAYLTGGFEQFGSAINSGRVFMLGLNILSSLFLFLSLRHLTNRVSTALFGVIIFIVSPLGVILHRQLLVDNIAILWLFISLYLLIISQGRLGLLVWSAIAFGLGFWSKISVVLLFWPILIYWIGIQAPPKQRRVATVLWGTITLAMMTLFPLMALLKDELLPSGVLWSSSVPHVSLLETFFQQRQVGISSLANFVTTWQRWLVADPGIIGLGLIIVILGSILFWRKNHALQSVFAMLLLYNLFLIIGNTAHNQDAVTTLALIALGSGLVSSYTIDWLVVNWPQVQKALTPIMTVVIILILSYGMETNLDHFLLNRTAAQTAAIEWMGRTLPPDSTLIVDTSALIDLRTPSQTDGKIFSKAHAYTFANNDPEIRSNLLADQWQLVDYVTVNNANFTGRPQMEGLDLMSEVVQNSTLVQTFTADDFSVELRRVRKPIFFETPTNPLLTRTWESYKVRFIEQGRVIDPARNNATTSEGQSYAMLRAVYMNDRETFDAVWQWTQTNLRRTDNTLIAWLWGQREDGTWGILDESGATDADQDIALALLLASRRWEDETYLEAARLMIHDIWVHKTDLWDDRPVLVAGDWAKSQYQAGTLVINPSYFAPYAYRIFAEVDPDHPWLDLVDSSYFILSKIQNDPAWGGDIGLIPDWIRLDVSTGALRPFEEVPTGQLYAFDAIRVPWRIALDWIWFQDPQANAFLQNFQFLRRELETNQVLVAAYTLDGQPAVDYESTSTYATLLPALLFNGEPDIAYQTFNTFLVLRLRDDENGVYWEQPDNYYVQNWAWFSVAVLDGTFANYWGYEANIDWERLGLEE